MAIKMNQVQYHGETIKLAGKYKYLATDDDGSVGAFVNKPWMSIGYWDCKSQDVRLRVAKIDITNIEWEQTLEKVVC